MIRGIDLTWLGHASFKAEADGKVVYFDPWKLADGPLPADLIAITHAHFDHCSPEDAAKIRGGETKIVTVKDCADQLTGDVSVIAPGETLTVGGLEVEAVPAYNLGKDFHPKANGWVGLIVELAGQRIYHAGDTDLIPEMSEVSCDIALLPCGGKYTMNADEAAQAANTIRPEVAVPMHFGDIVGSGSDADRFRQQCECEVVALEPTQ